MLTLAGAAARARQPRLRRSLRQLNLGAPGHTKYADLTWIRANTRTVVHVAAMEWQVHYESGGRQFSAPAADRSTAIAVAGILIRDGHEQVRLLSTAGEAIEPDEIRRLCQP